MVDDLFEPAEDGTFVLRLQVSPGAGRSAVVGRHGDAVKVRVAAPPERGRANDACRALVAAVFGVGADAVELVGGASGRAKRVRVAGVDPDEVGRLLGVALDEAGRRPAPRPPGNVGPLRGVR